MMVSVKAEIHPFAGFVWPSQLGLQQTSFASRVPPE
jgi:hypothetical protein